MSFQIYRDKWGIPHIRAGSELELAYAQGVNVALDRGWQLEVERLRSKGVSAAALGKEYLEWDKFARRSKLDETAINCFQQLDSDTREWLCEYVKGVNSALGKNKNTAFEKHAIEPQAWEPWTPISVWFSTHILMGGFPSKIWREELIQRLGEQYLDYFTSEDLWRAESNGWYIPPSKTLSGKSIQAGDPHRVIELPCCYQQVHLSCDEYTVLGFAIPGIPGIAHFGHAGSVAWSITNAMADYQDLFFERIYQKGDAYYCQGPEGEEPVDICKDVIEVRGEKSVKIDVLETPRGPIIVEGRDARLPISIQLPARKYSVSGFEALRSLLHAESVDDVEQAFSYWVEPVNVLQLSDVNGKFVSKVVGQVPDRSTENFKRIVPAWSPDSVWIGRIEGKRSDNSEQAAVMANQRGLASDMGTEFSPEHRANRILSLVNFRDLWSVGEVQQIHTDTYLSTAPIILDIVASLSDLSQAAFRLQQILIRWDCNMEANSVEAALFSKLRANVVQQVSKVPDFQVMNSIIEQSEYSELFYPWLSLTSRIAFALNTLLTNEDLGLDVTSIVRKSLIDLSAEQHLDETWAEIHTITPWNTYRDERLNSWPGIGGDHDCVLSSYSVPGLTHSCWRAPVARYIWDLENIENSQWIVQFGANDDPVHEHFSNQFDIWRQGSLVPVSVEWDEMRLESTVELSEVNLCNYSHAVNGLGRFEVRPVNPRHDSDLIHSWVTQERAQFWGMANYDKQYIEFIYQYLDVHPHHDIFFIAFENQSVALVQLYDPRYEEVGDKFVTQAGDIGLHIFVAPAKNPVAGFTLGIFNTIKDYVFSNSDNKRIVAEPDSHNIKALSRFKRLGFVFGEQVELTSKTAQLVYFEREVR